MSAPLLTGSPFTAFQYARSAGAAGRSCGSSGSHGSTKSSSAGRTGQVRRVPPCGHAKSLMFADADGEPILEGDPVPDGEGFRTGVFAFVVAEMRVKGKGE